MFRLNKLTDYALVVMQHVASHPEEPLHTARGLAAATELPVPTVVKILKELLDHRLLVSHRGVKGGYAPARKPSDISVAEIIEAFEGSIGFTECATAPGRCELEGRCKVQDNSVIIGQVLQRALGNISLSDMTATLDAGPRRRKRENKLRGNMVTSISLGPITSGSITSDTRGVQ
jgi:FeS assembly SUF system regulator